MNYQQAAFKASYGLASQLPPHDRPEIVFSGRSNVGKSSLINKLCNRKSLARVSATPGKTATINYYDLAGAYFVDLPGYGYAKVSAAERARWNQLIDRYFSTPTRCTLLVQLLDSRHLPSEGDLLMLEYLQHFRIPFIAALTKTDKLKRAQLDQMTAQLGELCGRYGCSGVYPVSAQSGAGVEPLQNRLLQAAEAAQQAVQL